MSSLGVCVWWISSTVCFVCLVNVLVVLLCVVLSWGVFLVGVFNVLFLFVLSWGVVFVIVLSVGYRFSLVLGFCFCGCP